MRDPIDRTQVILLCLGNAWNASQAVSIISLIRLVRLFRVPSIIKVSGGWGVGVGERQP